MLFQQHMRLPIDAEILPPSDAPDENAPDVNTAVRALMKSREKVFKKAESNILSAQKKQKETYDRKHQPAEIAVGTESYWKILLKSRGRVANYNLHGLVHMLSTVALEMGFMS